MNLEDLLEAMARLDTKRLVQIKILEDRNQALEQQVSRLENRLANAAQKEA